MSIFSTTREVGSFLKSNVEIAGEMLKAARAGAISPYHYMKPLILRAAELGEPPLAPTPYEVVYTKGPMRLLHYAPEKRKYENAHSGSFIRSSIAGTSWISCLVAASLNSWSSQGFDVYAVRLGHAWPGSNGISRLGRRRQTYSSKMPSSGRCAKAEPKTSQSMAIVWAARWRSPMSTLHSDRNTQFRRPSDACGFFPKGASSPLGQRLDRFDVDALVDAYGNVPNKTHGNGFFFYGTRTTHDEVARCIPQNR